MTTPQDPRPLTSENICHACVERLIALGLQVGETAQLALVADVRFDDAFGRAAAIWRVDDELYLEGWWTSAQPRHAMIRNATRRRGMAYARMCSPKLERKLKLVLPPVL